MQNSRIQAPRQVEPLVRRACGERPEVARGSCLQFASCILNSVSMPKRSEGHEGWDDYAPFYDWENARTFGRRDVPFWRNLALHAGGPVLELGCGTGRIALPLGRAGVPLVGIDRSAPMLARARARVRRGELADRVRLIRGDIRFLPLRKRCAAMVMAPYGMLQSLLRERDLAATLDAVHAVLQPGGTFGVELVADLPAWEEYRKRVSLKGWRAPPRRRARDADRDRPAGPRPPADDLRPGVHRAARRRARTPHVFADLPHAVGAADGAPAREGRVRGHGAAWRLPRRGRGIRGPRCG